MSGLKQFINKLLAIANIALGIGIVLVTISHNISPGVAAWIQITGLLFPLMAILSVIFLIYFAYSKSKFVFLSLLIVVISFSRYQENFQITFNNQVKPEQEDEFKLLSYNVQRFGINNKNEGLLTTRDTILNFLTAEDADIYCIQEYNSTSSNLYEPLKKIRDNLGAATYYYESYYNPRYNQLSGLVIFSGFQAVNKGKLKFTGSRTFGIFMDIIMNNDTVRVFNIHLASIKLQPEDLDYVLTTNPKKVNQINSIEIYNKLANAYKLREKQVEQLSDEIEQSPYPVILCGDFNDNPNSWAYYQINSLLKDSYKKKGMGLSKTYNGPIPLLRIDYIFYDDNFKTIGYKRYRTYWSDHFPISAIISQN